MNRSSTVGMPSSRSPPPRLRDRHPSHRLRLVAPREEFLAKPRPVHAQMVGQRFDCHPVDAGTARILSNTLQCGQKVPAFARLLHQVAGSWALLSVPSRGPSTRKRDPCGFTAPAVCALGPSSDVCGMASPRGVGVSPSPSFGPSPPARLLWPLLTSRSEGLAARVTLSGAGRDLPG